MTQRQASAEVRNYYWRAAAAAIAKAESRKWVSLPISTCGVWARKLLLELIKSAQALVRSPITKEGNEVSAHEVYIPVVCYLAIEEELTRKRHP